MRAGLCLPLLLAAAWAPAQTRPAPKETAGAGLARAYEIVRAKYPDAEFLSADAKTNAEGCVVCEKAEAAQDGWHYEFRSVAGRAFLLVIECRGRYIGPMSEIVEVARGGQKWPVKGKFIDSDRALKVLSRAGISLDPFEHHASGRRPFSMKLLRLETPGSAPPPVVWQVKVGEDAYAVDADTERILEGAPTTTFGTAVLGDVSEGAPPGYGGPGSSSGAASAGEAAKPSRWGRKGPKGSAKADIDRVEEYAARNLPGAFLMGIDGIASAYGIVSCAGEGDGWMYYYYWPRSGAFETVYACNGSVGPGKNVYIPVDSSRHNGISGEFVDSDKAMAGLLTQFADVMNEGMGRKNSRLAPMRLVNFRSPPLADNDLFKLKQFWEIEVGLQIFYVDAKTGRFAGQKGK